MLLNAQNEIEFKRLQRNLTALIEFSKSVNSSLDLDFTLNNLLLSCMGKFLTTRGFVGLFTTERMVVSKHKGMEAKFLSEFPVVTKTDVNWFHRVQQYAGRRGMIAELINSSRGPLGCIGLGRKINEEPYTEEETNFLKTILNIASTAIENSGMIDNLTTLNRSLDSRVNRLGALFELSKEFGTLLEEERIAKLLVYSILGNFLISTYAILHLSDRSIKILQSTIPKRVVLESLTIEAILNSNAVLTEADVSTRYPQLAEIGCVLFIPLLLRSETKGVLLLGQRLDKKVYSSEDIEFINSIASLALVSLENRRLFKEALEKQKLEEELELAKEIQRNLLPKTLPWGDGFEIVAETIPSKYVSGDYYDVITLPDGNLCIAIADVSGKGVPASLLMANVQAFLKSVCKQNLPIGAASALLNDLISENTSDGRFITFFWMYYDSKRRVIRYVNAGHNPPILLRGGNIHYLDKGGMIFGVMKTLVPYEVQEVELLAGDRIVLFTDGVTEAKNETDEEYSDRRLEKVIVENEKQDANFLLTAVLDDVRAFVKGAEQSDDITILTLRIQ